MKANQKKPVDQSLLSTISNVKDIINYQDDSVVSRTIINKQTGTVSIFAFDKGQSLSEHSSPFDAIVSVIDGKVDVKISGKSYILEQGEIIIMPADEPHALVALDKFIMLLIMIKD